MAHRSIVREAGRYVELQKAPRRFSMRLDRVMLLLLVGVLCALPAWTIGCAAGDGGAAPGSESSGIDASIVAGDCRQPVLVL